MKTTGGKAVTSQAPGGPVTGVVWDPDYLEHKTDAGHPEHPRRLGPLYRRLADPGLKSRFTTITPTAASDDEILLAHSPAYLAKVKATASVPTAALSNDTLTCDQSFRVAKLSVGGTLEAIRRVVAGSLAHALVLARPPGHHAERTRAMGYCIFNNVAIGARFARTSMGLARVLVVDWDLHHGNGTQHQFERDPSVFFFSSHQFPHYPGTGHFTETGLGPGEGTSMNVPLGRGCGDAEFAAIYRRLLTPVAAAIRPELILVSAGFDIHTSDPLGSMRVTPAGFKGLTRIILEMARQTCAGRVVFCLEGGYHAEALADSVLAMIDELTGKTYTDVDVMAAGADARLVNRVVKRCIHTHQRFFGGR
jgi:acetoin utilization deacetylase AcuC-like enzyme